MTARVGPGARRLLISWLAAWPTITILLVVLTPVMSTWPLALRTLVLSGLMVLIMQFLAVPLLQRLLPGVGRAAAVDLPVKKPR